MSLGACLPGLEAEGKITPEQAAEARAIYEERLQAHARHGTRETAEALASEETLAALERNITRKEFVAGLTIKKRAELVNDLARYGKDNPDPRFKAIGDEYGRGNWHPDALPALIDWSPYARYSNVEARRKAILGELHAYNDKLLIDHNSNLLGQVRNKAQLDRIGDEMFGKATGDEAAGAVANAMRRALEVARQRFNKAGGDIGFRADWGAPQRLVAKKVRAVDFDEFRADMMQHLAIDRMVDQETGLPMTPEKLELILPDSFAKIRSDGASEIDPGHAASGETMLANTRSEARFFVYKDYASWKAINEKYGSGSLYESYMDHLAGMARDTAALEILGPNPPATLRYLADTARQQASRDMSAGSKALPKADKAIARMEKLYDEYSGKPRKGTSDMLANVGAAYRAFNVSRTMGSAIFSAMTDFSFTNSNAAINGISRVSFLKNYLELMAPGSGGAQARAIRHGFIAEEMASRNLALGRATMDEMANGLAGRMASATLRLGLLARHTQSARWAYPLAMLDTFTSAAGKSFDDLPMQQRGLLQRYGLGKAEWDKLRSAPMKREANGSEWMATENLADTDALIGQRFREMILTEVDSAVPVHDLGTRTTMNNLAQKGTLFGEMMKSGPLFLQSFNVAVVTRQATMMAAMNIRHAGAPAFVFKYATGLILGNWVLGAVVMQLRALANGKDPRPMDDPKFWIAALRAGGAFGIYGDMLFNPETYDGRGALEIAGGKLAQDIGDVGRYAGMAFDERKDPRTRITRTLRGATPGNNLFYTRLMMDRLMWDQIEEMTNPDVAQARRRMMQFDANEGTDRWWQPGDTAPQRMPDLYNAVEGFEQ
jgi:hypothetical protein